MLLRFLVMGLTAVLVLAFIWIGNRRSLARSKCPPDFGSDMTRDTNPTIEDLAVQIMTSRTSRRLGENTCQASAKSNRSIAADPINPARERVLLTGRQQRSI